MKRPARKINNPSHEATWHNQNRDAIEDRTPLESKDIQVIDRPGRGFELLLKREEPTGGGLDVRRCLIIDVLSDYITVVEHPDDDGDGAWDVTTHPDLIKSVAKPPAFRGVGFASLEWVTVAGSSFNGRQNGTAPGTVLQQSIEPPYASGLEIYVAFGIKNGTGVHDGDGEHIRAMDVTPGRMWVDGLQSVCVKIGTKKEQMQVRGSSPTITP